MHTTTIKTKKMNIFFLDKNPQKCAEFHCNKHISKMVVELGQLMCTTRHLLGDKSHINYRKTHEFHPIQNWLKSNPHHYYWTLALGFALCNEYSYRYEKKHKTEKVMEECRNSFFGGNIPHFSSATTSDLSFDDCERVYNLCSVPALAMPDEYKVEGDAIQSYRRYYALNKYFTIDFRYKKRQQPEWIGEIQRENQEIIRRYQISAP